jgi:hypothetical protein
MQMQIAVLYKVRVVEEGEQHLGKLPTEMTMALSYTSTCSLMGVNGSTGRQRILRGSEAGQRRLRRGRIGLREGPIFG